MDIPLLVRICLMHHLTQILNIAAQVVMLHITGLGLISLYKYIFRIVGVTCIGLLLSTIAGIPSKMK